MERPKRATQAQLFLNGIAVMQFIFAHVTAIAPGLLDEMTAVAGGVDQDVIRTRFHSAFDDGLQKLVLGLESPQRRGRPCK